MRREVRPVASTGRRTSSVCGSGRIHVLPSEEPSSDRSRGRGPAGAGPAQIMFWSCAASPAPPRAPGAACVPRCLATQQIVVVAYGAIRFRTPAEIAVAHTRRSRHQGPVSVACGARTCSPVRGRIATAVAVAIVLVRRSHCCGLYALAQKKEGFMLHPPVLGCCTASIRTVTPLHSSTAGSAGARRVLQVFGDALATGTHGRPVAAVACSTLAPVATFASAITLLRPVHARGLGAVAFGLWAVWFACRGSAWAARAEPAAPRPAGSAGRRGPGGLALLYR